jgi:hypothetical protein
MAKNFNSQLSGQTGEHLVVAELGRRGVVATPFAGNVPDIDVLAYANGKSLPIQVKALRKGEISTNGNIYLDIRFDGDTQIIDGKSEEIDRELVFVLVKIGKHYGEDDFFIFNQGVVQDLIFREYSKFLDKHNGIRPRNPRTTHCAYHVKDVVEYRDNWDLIFERLGMD